ncbi:MAG: LacI family DNA-binding transcriptional regulator [Terriglobales bacterium]
MVTIRDVAGESGVSVTTVSIVLNDGPSARRISDRTRRRIWKTANRLGYRPNLFARSLRSKRSQNLGVVVFDITDPYGAQILRAIETHVQPSGYFPVLADLQNDRSQFQRCLDVLFERRVEGIIAIANWTHLETKLFTEISKRNIPAVVIGRELTGHPISSVVVDNAAGTRQVLQHLYELGHSKIAFIKGPKTLVDSAQRWRGLESFAHEVGLTFDPELVVEIKGRNSTYTEGYQLAEQLAGKSSDFTALVAFDDLTACAAIRALTKSGRVVPKDCSVVGFDDIPSSAFYNPPLTTIQQQLELQGSLGAEIVEELIRASVEKRTSVPRHRKVAPRLIVRESTCPAPRS